MSSSSYDNTLRLYSWEDERLLHTFHDEYTDKVYGVNHSPDGSFLMACSEYHGQSIISCWDAKSGSLVARMVGHQQQVYSCFFHPCKGYVVSVSLDKTIKVWDLGVCFKEFPKDGRELDEKELQVLAAEAQQNYAAVEQDIEKERAEAAQEEIARERARSLAQLEEAAKAADEKEAIEQQLHEASIPSV